MYQEDYRILLAAENYTSLYRINYKKKKLRQKIFNVTMTKSNIEILLVENRGIIYQVQRYEF